MTSRDLWSRSEKFTSSSREHRSRLVVNCLGALIDQRDAGLVPCFQKWYNEQEMTIADYLYLCEIRDMIPDLLSSFPFRINVDQLVFVLCAVQEITNKSIHFLFQTTMAIDLKALAHEFTSNYYVFGIVMVGAGGTGKTSLVSTMRNKINESPATKNFVFEPTDRAIEAALQEKYRTLSEGMRLSEISTDAQFIDGTQYIEAYRFQVGNGKEKWFDIVLVDVPGEWYKSTLNQELLELVSQAHVVINTVDAPFLMEERGQYCETYNKPAEFFNFLKKVFVMEGDRKRMIQFVPIKSEKYARTSVYRDELYQHWLGVYKPVRDWVNGSNNCIGCFCPVSTLGGMEFSHFENRGNNCVRSIFKPNGKGFSPQGVHLPLLLALRFIFKQKNANIGYLNYLVHLLFTGYFNDFYKALGNVQNSDTDLANTVHYFGNQQLI